MLRPTPAAPARSRTKPEQNTVCVLPCARFRPSAREASGRTLALANVGQTYYAVDAHCPNDGTNLARDGRLAGYTLECPADGSAYDIRTGARTGPDSGPALARYPIRVEGNLIYVGRMRMAA